MCMFMLNLCSHHNQYVINIGVLVEVITFFISFDLVPSIKYVSRI